MRTALNVSKYKTLPRIRVDVWGNVLSKNFKRKKWSGLISTLKYKQRRRRKAKLSLPDHIKENLPKFPVYHRYIYQNNLFIRIHIRLFYGRLQDHKIKKLCAKGKNQSYLTFIRNIEIKPPIFLYRAKLLNSYSEGVIHQKQKRFLINGSPNKKVVQAGDVLHFPQIYETFLRRRLRLKRRIINYRFYLHNKFVLNWKPQAFPDYPYINDLEKIADEKNKQKNRIAYLRRIKRIMPTRSLYNKNIKTIKKHVFKVDFVINEAFDFDVNTFRFFFFDNIYYFKNHPFTLPYLRLKQWYTRT